MSAVRGFKTLSIMDTNIYAEIVKAIQNVNHLTKILAALLKPK